MPDDVKRFFADVSADRDSVECVLATDYDRLRAERDALAAVVKAASRWYKGKTENREAEREIGSALSALDAAVAREVG